MGRHPQDVTDAELAVLKVLWNKSPATIRQITQQLYPRCSESDYGTVKKLLARLQEKRCVRKNRRQIPHEFTAAITLDDLVGRRLQNLANQLCDGSPTPLLMHLLQGRGISRQQQQELQKLIEEFSATKKVGKR